LDVGVKVEEPIIQDIKWSRNNNWYYAERGCL